MKYIKLRNGYKLPILGLGTFLMSDEEVIETVKEAIKIGYRHFDTAQMYNNEKAVGFALKESKLKREEYFITTKLQYHSSPQETKRKIEQSLLDLKTSYIDLFLIHWPNHDLEINLRTWKIIESYYEKGIFKAIGVSNFTRYQLKHLIKHAKIMPMVNQIETHPGLSQVPMKKFLDSHDIRLMAYGPLMRNALIHEPYKSTLDKIGKNYNASIQQIAIAFGVNRNLIMIPKTVTKSRLEENFQAQFIVLTKNEMKDIFSLNAGKRLYTDPANNIYGVLKE